ncbi:hypothetical protein [Anaeromicropila herbilytica]|uniref:Uncharacterized protein n=1 Tax=Anaeromicropila herbilytica TaxID=2785025 RepID=A0A7R7EPJ5_9FIRM|nr:hypothetical protein [Anaeromicropila herbilytica]BCN32360.1 hypothetical protein bsdtb5_36550 [Anaeromicropila herbilytica]
MDISIYGEDYYEKMMLEYEGKIIYQGYIDDFVTSEKGNLELKLNYDSNKNQSIILKKMKDKIVFVPNVEICFSSEYNYEIMMISIKEFEDLWIKMKYNPSNDLELICEITNEDILLMWLLTSGYRNDNTSINIYIEELKENCIGTSNEEIQIEEVFDKVLYAKSHFTECIYEDIGEKIYLYLDNGVEWNALTKGTDNNLYLNIKYNIMIKL